MILDRVGPGKNAPNEINVIIEIPMRGEPVKYEVDKETGAMFVDRFMDVSMVYPCNYGYVPHTLSEDGDPVDVLVLTPVPLISGSVIKSRPIGLLQMHDENGPDHKVLAVPGDKTYKSYTHLQDIKDMNPAALARIAHFFERYKDLESGKWVRLDGWLGAEEARTEVVASLQRYGNAPVKPNF